MYKLRLLQLLFVVLAFVSVTYAAAQPYKNGSKLVARQGDLLDGVLPGDDDDSNGDVQTPTQPPSSTESGDEPTSTAVEPSSTASEEEEVESTTEPPVSSTQNPEPTTTATNDEEEVSSTEAPEPTSTNAGSSRSSSSSVDEEEDRTTTDAPVLSTAFETVTRTNEDGSKETSTSKTVSTLAPETQDGDGKGDDGLSDKTRDIIIGVVVGIGGAILLGAIGVVAWRIRNRKKKAEESASLMEDYGPETKSDPPGSAAGTNRGSVGPGRSPFQSTLDTYHQPTQPVNTSSNF